MTTATYPDSYYAATANQLITRPPLEESIRCDVCVIGGGLTGLNAALNLAEKGYQVVLLESERIGWGASGRNGGHAGGDPRHGVEELEELLGVADAHRHWDLNRAALVYFKSLIDKHQIACDWRPGNIHATFNAKETEHAKHAVEKMQREYNAEHISFISPQEMREKVGCSDYHGGELNSENGHLHPLNYTLGVARAAEKAGVRIFEDSRVLSNNRGEPSTLTTAQGQVIADKVVLGCNGYLEKLEPRIAGKIMPINNYILATEPLPEALARSLIRDNESVSDSKFVVNYFRLSADNRMLFGGGETYTKKFPTDMKSYVRKYMLRIYPQLAEVKIDYAWGGTLAVTMNRLASFGRIDNLYYAQGYSGHGLVLATFAGKLLADAISGHDEEFDVFARVPMPTFPGGTLLRWPGLVAGMLYYSLLDKFK